VPLLGGKHRTWQAIATWLKRRRKGALLPPLFFLGEMAHVSCTDYEVRAIRSRPHCPSLGGPGADIPEMSEDKNNLDR
jgi:hypothetical protein